MKTDYPMKKRETYQVAFYSLIGTVLIIAIQVIIQYTMPEVKKDEQAKAIYYRVGIGHLQADPQTGESNVIIKKDYARHKQMP